LKIMELDIIAWDDEANHLDKYIASAK